MLLKDKNGLSVKVNVAESIISKETEDYVGRYIQRLENGEYEEEYQRRRQAEIGCDKPMDLSTDGIAKEVDKFVQTLDWLAELMPDEFGINDKQAITDKSEKGISRKRKQINGVDDNK